MNLNCDAITANSYLWLDQNFHAFRLAGRAWFRRFGQIYLSRILSKPAHASRRNRYRNDKRTDIDTLCISLWCWITHAAPR